MEQQDTNLARHGQVEVAAAALEPLFGSSQPKPQPKLIAHQICTQFRLQVLPLFLLLLLLLTAYFTLDTLSPTYTSVISHSRSLDPSVLTLLTHCGDQVTGKVSLHALRRLAFSPNSASYITAPARFRKFSTHFPTRVEFVRTKAQRLSLSLYMSQMLKNSHMQRLANC